MKEREIKTETESPSTISFKLAFGKQISDLSVPTSTTIGELKEKVQELTSVHPNMQKLLYKGQLNAKPDAMTLSEASIINGARIILMAAKMDDILNITTGKPTKETNVPRVSAPIEQWRDMTEHKKVLEKGKPEISDIEPGLIGQKLTMPSSGWIVAVNKYRSKTRLSFKGEEMWLATAERTQKVPLHSVRSVSSQAQDDLGEYHIVALQLGPTDASRYFLYWVPCQYVTIIKDLVHGTYNTFL
jgi:hypothetical protein